MTDMLLEVSRRKAARRAVQALGLPLPLPRVLERSVGPWARRELAGRAIGLVGFGDADVLGDAVARVVGEAGAAVSGTMPAPFQRASEAFGIPRGPRDAALHALLVDATALETIDQLRAGPAQTTTKTPIAAPAGSWFDELQPLVRRIAASGRLVVFAPCAADEGAEAAAVAAALEGFVRSVAKEIGRRGATANLIIVEAGAELRATAVARFLLSPRSAFVTAQPIRATRFVRASAAHASSAWIDTMAASIDAMATSIDAMAISINAMATSNDAAREVEVVGAPDRKAAVATGASRELEVVGALDRKAAVATGASRELEVVGALDRKVAVVTGASRGIGEATARRLAEEGAHVVCVDRPAEEGVLARVARAIGGEVFLADVAADTTPAALAAFLRERYGGVDIVVHNAGITRDRTLAKMSESEWNAVLDVNLRAAIRINDALLAENKSTTGLLGKKESDHNFSGGKFQPTTTGNASVLRDGGRIVCLSSVAGIAGNVGQTAYAASKAGLIGYVRALAADVAARGITVNAVAPGFIETRMTAAIPFAIREAGRRLSALGQGGLPIDVAEVIVFLALPAAIGVSGAVLRVCGGALIGA